MQCSFFIKTMNNYTKFNFLLNNEQTLYLKITELLIILCYFFLLLRVYLLTFINFLFFFSWKVIRMLKDQYLCKQIFFFIMFLMKINICLKTIEVSMDGAKILGIGSTNVRICVKSRVQSVLRQITIPLTPPPNWDKG